MEKLSKQAAPIRASQTTSEAFAAVLGHHLDFLEAWEGAARTWEDIEGVHQTRVAFRRMRSLFGTFAKAFPKQVTRPWNDEMRWLANQLGLARDLDVFIDEGLGAVRGILHLPGEAQLMVLAETQRAKAYEQVGEMLDSERYATFKSDCRIWVNGRAWEHSCRKKKQRKHQQMGLVSFARKALDDQAHQVLAAGSHVDRHDAEQMHRLRIECKKLRYTAEFFKPVFLGIEEFIAHMKGLQDLLGVMNDVSVMEQLLALLLRDHVGPDAPQYAGGLVGWRTREFQELLNGFDSRWEELVEAKRPWWKKSAVIQ